MQAITLSRLFLASVLLACLPAVGHAQSAQSNSSQVWEFGADVIYQDSADLKFEGGSTLNLDADWGIALIFGYRFNEHLGLGFSLDWQQVDYDVTLNSGLFPGVQFSGHGDMEAFTPRVWLDYNFTEGNVTPFVNAGVGWSFVDTNIPTSQLQVGCWWDPWWGYICTPYQNTKSVDYFVYQLGAGLRWDISDVYAMRFAYEKHWIDYSKATSTPDFDQWKLGFTFRY